MVLRRRQVLALSKALAVSSLLAGCSTDGPAGIASPRPQSTTDKSPTESSSPTKTSEKPTQTLETPTGITATPIREVTYGNTVFGVDLLQTIATGNENRLFSPYSVAIALAMTYAGARGETRSQMESTLHYPFEGEELHGTIQSLHDTLIPEGQEDATPTPTPTPDGERYDIPLRFVDANALWGQEGFPWREAYLSLVERYYAAGLHQLDFAADPEDARSTINDWVAETTREKITDLLPPGSISSATRLVLTNAVYFQALWENPFTPSDTESNPFTALDGSTADIPLMTIDDKGFPYAKVDGHQLVELPYRGGEFGMVIILPPEGEYNAFQESLTAERLWRWLSRLEFRAGTLSIPKFTFDSGFELKKVLAELGMPAAFDSSRADLSGMAEGGAGEALFIDEVYHKTFISVDEKGTEAAAATGVVIPVSAVKGPEPFEMTVDRPFLFLIRERQTGAILFLGRMVDASEAQPGNG